MSTSKVVASEVDAPPRALATMAGAMVAVLASVRDADVLDRECISLAAHAEASAAAEARLAADRAALEHALGRRLALPGSLGVSVPPELGRQILAEAMRLGEDAAALAIEVLRLVFTPDGAGHTILGAVLDNRSAR